MTRFSFVVVLVVTLSVFGDHVLEVAAATGGQTQFPGLGATKKAWNKSHEMDRAPKLARACCYLPKVLVNGDYEDTWVAVIFDDPPKKRVLQYIRNFPDGTDEDFALLLLQRDDLPLDSVFLWEKIDGDCKLRQYSSPSFARALGEPSWGPQVALISESDEEFYPYTNSKVEEAILTFSPVEDRDVLC